jgi:hypothetical protein
VAECILLITRQEGENSGLNTCKAANRMSVAPVARIATHAAGPAICDTSLVAATGFVATLFIASSRFRAPEGDSRIAS